VDKTAMFTAVFAAIPDWPILDKNYYLLAPHSTINAVAGVDSSAQGMPAIRRERHRIDNPASSPA
jgi:hypothetical protein